MAAPCEDRIVDPATVIGYAPTPIVAVDAGGQIRYCNKAFSDLIGYTCEEVLRIGLLSAFLPPEWRCHAAAFFNSGKPTANPASHGMELLRKNGTRTPVELKLNLAGDGRDSQPLSILCFTELTGHKLVESAISIRDSGMIRALRVARIGTWDIDVMAGIFACSDEVRRIVGADSLGTVISVADVKSYICPEDSDRVREAFAKSIRSGDKLCLIFRIRSRAGSPRIVSVEGETLHGQDGKVVRLLGTIQDITERKRAEDELKAAKAQAELYVDLMGHDINNMNQIAMGYLELAADILETQGSLGKDDRFLLFRPIETLRDNSRLIDNVRKVQKSKAGVYRTEPIEIEPVLRDVIARYSSISGRDVDIRLVSSCSCTVLANELLQEVFLNLVGNAIKHSAGPLSVNIAADKYCDGGAVKCRIAVEDNGPGITDDLKKKLFDRLSLEKTRASGKGFGLCLTKLLVDDFNGQFWVEDRVAGDSSQGCRFVVLLPAVDKCG